MSSLVDIWVSELAKLGKRRRAGASRRKAESGVEEEGRQEEAQEVRSQEQRLPRRPTLSEATVCMLMDRFAPC